MMKHRKPSSHRRSLVPQEGSLLEPSQPSEKKRYRKPSPRKHQTATYLMAGGSMLALVGLLVDIRDVVRPVAPSNVCQEIVQPKSVLSRDELARLLQVPERDRKETIRAIVSEPYCRLPKVEIRAGVPVQREAYPLAFDPQTWFVVLYEGDKYAGYSFVFPHQR